MNELKISYKLFGIEYDRKLFLVEIKVGSRRVHKVGLLWHANQSQPQRHDYVQDLLRGLSYGHLRRRHVHADLARLRQYDQPDRTRLQLLQVDAKLALGRPAECARNRRTDVHWHDANERVRGRVQSL